MHFDVYTRYFCYITIVFLLLCALLMHDRDKNPSSGNFLFKIFPIAYNVIKMCWVRR